MEKRKIDNKYWALPDLGGSIIVPLVSTNKQEQFLLDIRRGRMHLKRQKFQTRVKEVIPLVRLDIGSPHRNPDGEEIKSPHIHIYKEGYGDKWAIPVPEHVFKDTDDFWQTLHDFMSYCSVIEVPNFQKGLFS